MGVNDRKEREKEELRALILAAAVEVFLQKGFDNTSIRAIADKIEYSPTTIYLYFKDKAALFHAIHQEGFKLMFHHFGPLQQVADHFERLLLQGRYYLDFAFQNPELYDLMFLQPGTMEALPEDLEWMEGNAAFASLVQNVQACIDARIIWAESAEVLAFTIWASIHGIASLQIQKRCNKVISEHLKPHIATLAFEQVNLMLKSYRIDKASKA